MSSLLLPLLLLLVCNAMLQFCIHFTAASKTAICQIQPIWEGICTLQCMVLKLFKRFYCSTKASTTRKTYWQFSFLQITTFFCPSLPQRMFEIVVQFLQKFTLQKWHSKQTTFKWCHCYCWWCSFFAFYVCVCMFDVFPLRAMFPCDSCIFHEYCHSIECFALTFAFITQTSAFNFTNKLIFTILKEKRRLTPLR